MRRKQTVVDIAIKLAGFNRLQVAEAFFRSQIELEVREIGLLDFGFERDTHLDEVLNVIEERRCQQLYPHRCNDKCASKGCGSVWVMDGHWKHTFQHCAFVQEVICAFLSLGTPLYCTQLL